MNTPSSRQILITPYPFDSPVGAALSQALDHELEAMYPDWDDLPHPGFQLGKVGGDSLVKRPADKGSESVDGPVLAALDADADIDTGEGVPGTEGLTDEQIAKLHFFVAFDVTDKPPTTAGHVDGHLSGSLPSVTSVVPGEPVGCIGVKLMPYFPHHRPQHPDASGSPEQLPGGSGAPPRRYAEVKRLYIAPSHRGVLASPVVRNLSAPATPARLASQLVGAATEFATTILRATNLVLETGVRQRAAVKLYQRLGWKSRPDYGDYVGAGEADGGVSRCYELVVG